MIVRVGSSRSLTDALGLLLAMFCVLATLVTIRSLDLRTTLVLDDTGQRFCYLGEPDNAFRPYALTGEYP